MDLGVAIALGSLVVAAVVAFLQWRKYREDRKLREKAELERGYVSPEQRESVAIEGANQAVKTMSAALNVAYADIARANERVRLVEQISAGKEAHIEQLEQRVHELEKAAEKEKR